MPLFNRVCQIQVRTLILRSIQAGYCARGQAFCKSGGHACAHIGVHFLLILKPQAPLISAQASLLCSGLTPQVGLGRGPSESLELGCGQEGLWLVHVGTESRCDPSQKRGCSAQSPSLRHVSSQAPWPGGLGGNCSRWSGLSGSFLISPGSLVSLPCQPASAQQPPRREAGRTGPSPSSWLLKGEAHIWLGLPHPRLGGSTHYIFVPRQPHHPPVTELSLSREVI